MGRTKQEKQCITSLQRQSLVKLTHMVSLATGDKDIAASLAQKQDLGSPRNLEVLTLSHTAAPRQSGPLAYIASHCSQ